MSDDSGTLRRRFDRFDVRDCSTEAMKSGGFLGMGAKQDIGGNIVDMSDSGLRFVGSEKPALGTTLKMNLNLSPIGETVSVKAVVRWVTTQGKQIIVGVEYDKLSDADRELFAKLREKLSRTSAK